jgi:plastocyanin
MRTLVSLAVALALGAAVARAAAPAARDERPAHRLSGRLVVTEKGTPADPSIDLTQAAVWYEPDEGFAPARPVTAEMSTVKKQFTPKVLVVPVGSSVHFVNQDPILHNAFSVSGHNAFDLGLVGAGKGKSVLFREAGLVRVFCNVHHAMFGHVLVVATPYVARPARDGAFVLAGLPSGGGRLHFWHERTEPSERRVEIPRTGDLRLEAPITLPSVPPHKNKFGRSYSRGAYD